MSWYSHVEPQLVRLSAQLTDEQDGIHADRRPHQNTLYRASHSTYMAEHLASEVKSARQSLDASWPRLTEVTARLRAVDQAVAFVHIAMSGIFGEHARSHAPRQDEVSRFVQRSVG